MDKSLINSLEPSPSTCVFSLDHNFPLRSSSSLHSNGYNYDLEACLLVDMNFITPTIPNNLPLNTPKTIQTPSSLVVSSLVSYALLLISNGFKYCLFSTGWLYMILVIIGITLHMFGSVLNTYGSDLNSIHHSYFYTHQCFPIAHPFPSLAPYPHVDNEVFIFVVPYDNICDILEYIYPHIQKSIYFAINN